tara:strand:+ start:3883 stop:4059 length:177 start_codon:yes stop_codon:yes gene_type:complete
MSADYRIRRIGNIIKRYEKKEAANIGDLVTALDAIKAEVAIHTHLMKQMKEKKKELVE